MYRIVLADDEEYVLESLLLGVRWEAHGFEIAATARNGLEAFELVRRLRPQVLMTDVRMPGLNGLELIRKTHDLDAGIRCIVISGHAEFAYAQKAMSFGAIGYCLKPFEEGEVAAVLGRAKEQLDRERSREGSEVLDFLEDPGPRTSERLYRKLSDAGLQPGEDRPFRLLAVLGRDGHRLEGKLVPTGTRLGTAKHVYFVPAMPLADLMRRLRADAAALRIQGMGLSRELHDLSTLESALEEAMLAAYQYFVFDRKDVYVLEDPPVGSPADLLQGLEAAALRGDPGALALALGRIDASRETAGFTIKQAFMIYNSAIPLLSRADPAQPGDYCASYEQLALTFTSFGNMLSSLAAVPVETRECAVRSPAEEITNETLRSVLQYIDQGYTRPLSLKTIGHRFHVHPSYLSTLFRKETGETFTDHLTRLRIGKACELLTTTESNVYEIAEKVGYTDYYYFAKVFRKTMGTTATRYRAAGA